MSYITLLRNTLRTHFKVGRLLRLSPVIKTISGFELYTLSAFMDSNYKPCPATVVTDSRQRKLPCGWHNLDPTTSKYSLSWRELGDNGDDRTHPWVLLRILWQRLAMKSHPAVIKKRFPEEVTTIMPRLWILSDMIISPDNNHDWICGLELFLIKIITMYNQLQLFYGN